MLVNFENITYDLTEDEKVMAKHFKSVIAGHRKDNPITSSAIVKWYKERGYKMTDVRVRKIVNYLVGTQQIPHLIGGGKGYYLGSNHKEVEDACRSLVQRAQSQLHRAHQVAKYYKLDFDKLT